MKKPADMLKAMAMPKKKMAEEEAGMDLESLGGDEMPEAEEKSASDMEEGLEGSEMEEASASDMEDGQETADLKQVSDEDLIKELRKRGLIDESEEKKIEAELQE